MIMKQYIETLRAPHANKIKSNKSKNQIKSNKSLIKSKSFKVPMTMDPRSCESLLAGNISMFSLKVNEMKLTETWSNAYEYH